MQTFEFAEKFIRAGKTIVRAEITAPGFVGFVEEVELARAAASAARPFAVCHLAERMRRRITLIADDGDRIALDPMGLSSLPARAGLALHRLVDQSDDVGAAGEVLQKGDGVAVPVLYRLGTPASVNLNGAEGSIAELEFQASTFGAIEAVVAADGDLARTAALIRHVAKPAGMMAAPSWLVDRISTADGLVIMREVLPAFFD